MIRLSFGSLAYARRELLVRDQQRAPNHPDVRLVRIAHVEDKNPSWRCVGELDELVVGDRTGARFRRVGDPRRKRRRSSRHCSRSFQASKPPPITVTFGWPDALITRATSSAASPPSLSYTMIGALSAGAGKPETALTRRRREAPKPRRGSRLRQLSAAGRASMSTCGTCLSIQASFSAGAAIDADVLLEPFRIALAVDLSVRVAQGLRLQQRIRAHHAGDARAEEHDAAALVLRQPVHELVPRRDKAG